MQGWMINMKIQFRNAYTQDIINEFDLPNKDKVLEMIDDFTNHKFIYIKSSSNKLIKAKFINFSNINTHDENNILYNLFFIIE